MWETVLNSLVWMTISVFATIITSVVLPAFANWLKSKTENEKLQVLISDITATVQTAVNHYEQTTVSILKKCGEWDSDAQRAVLESAVNEVITNLLDTTKKALEDNGQDIYDVVTRYIESYIQSQKGVK